MGRPRKILVTHSSDADVALGENFSAGHPYSISVGQEKSPYAL